MTTCRDWIYGRFPESSSESGVCGCGEAVPGISLDLLAWSCHGLVSRYWVLCAGQVFPLRGGEPGPRCGSSRGGADVSRMSWHGQTCSDGRQDCLGCAGMVFDKGELLQIPLCNEIYVRLENANPSQSPVSLHDFA